MALDPSLPLQIQQPNPANFISSFVDLGRKKLELDKARETFDADVSQRKSESSSAGSKADVDKASVGAAIRQNEAVAQTAETGAQSAQLGLKQKETQTGRSFVGALLQDPDFVNGNAPGMIEKLARARQAAIQSGMPAALAEANFGQLIGMAALKPKDVHQEIANITQQGLGAESQTAQGLVPAQSQQQIGGVDARGNPVMQSRDQFGNAAQGAVPTVQPPGQPPQQQAPAPLRFPAGESPDTYKTLIAEREAARTTMAQAPTVHRLNAEILDELHRATTGQYSGIIAKGQSIAGMLNLSLTGNNDAERAASAYDLIDKYTTMAATRAAQSMGNDTATALNAQLKQNASVERNPTAIRKSILFNDAVLSGAEAYQKGLEASIKSNPQADVFVKRAFDQAWAQNFDPVIMQLYQAQKSGDKAEVAEIKKSLGSVANQAKILQKAQALQSLMTKGL